jgi:glycine betaine transporter
MKELKHEVFWIPFLFLTASAIYSLIDVENFLYLTKTANDWILNYFGWLFSLSTLFFLGIVVTIYFSPLGKVRIGGKDASPILNKWRWFSITLCTTIATGILFWGAAEPIYHLHAPPVGLGIEPNSVNAAKFSLSTMFLHWTFTPYGIYTLAGLTFALVYYNLKQPFSLGSLLYPLIGKSAYGAIGSTIDAVCLFSLVAGMAASLGSGILTIAGGLNLFTDLATTPFLLAIIALVVVCTFIISAGTGLMKGIRILSDLNIKLFFGLCAFVFFFGPTSFILKFGVESFGDYLQHFFERSLYTGASANDNWANSWTIFYWANWLAWTPITALFLGRLAVGYTVKDFIRINLLYPSLFSCFWMMIFSGSAIYYDFIAENGSLNAVLQAGGAENVIYALFAKLPFTTVISGIFLFIAFLSYVTAADSNTTAMGGISATGISPSNPEPPLWIKIAWGATVGIIAWVMVAFAGIDGIKMASNLGGFPALFLILAVAFSLIKLAQQHKEL